MSAPKFTPWKVGGRVGSTAREGLVGLYAIDRAEPNKYQGHGVGYAQSLSDAKLAAAAPELYAALDDMVHGRDGAIERARAALGKAGVA